MILSPSINVPVSSQAIRRSASPSKAKAKIRGLYTHRLAHFLRVCRATAVIDILSIRLIVQNDNLCAQLFKYTLC